MWFAPDGNSFSKDASPSTSGGGCKIKLLLFQGEGDREAVEGFWLLLLLDFLLEVGHDGGDGFDHGVEAFPVSVDILSKGIRDFR